MSSDAYKRLHLTYISAELNTLAIAQTPSPDALFSTCSCGLGLERGWIAQRSLPAYKGNVLYLAAALIAFAVFSTGSAELVARRPAPDNSDTFTKTSRTHPLFLTPLKRLMEPTVQSTSDHNTAYRT